MVFIALKGIPTAFAGRSLGTDLDPAFGTNEGIGGGFGEMDSWGRLGGLALRCSEDPDMRERLHEGRSGMPELGDVEKRVIAFVVRQTAVDPQWISLYSRLAEDCGIAGDDGVELMTNFGKEFGVDLSGFNFADYFGSEGAFIPFALLFPSWWKARSQQHILTVADLVEMAKSGNWRVLRSDSCDSADGERRQR